MSIIKDVHATASDPDIKPASGCVDDKFVLCYLVGDDSNKFLDKFCNSLYDILCVTTIMIKDSLTFRAFLPRHSKSVEMIFIDDICYPNASISLFIGPCFMQEPTL